MKAMSTNLSLGFCATFFWCASAFAVTVLPEDTPEELLEDAQSSYIFVFQEQVKPGEIRRLAWRLTEDAGGQLRHVFTRAVKGFSASVPAEAAVRIAASVADHTWGVLQGIASKISGMPPAAPTSQ